MLDVIKKAIKYLQNQEIDIRIRMLFLLEYATFIACVIGTLAMLFFASSILILIPNFVLLLFSCLGIYFSHVKKKYDFAANFIIIGCAYATLPFMFFTAGGNYSGMPLWFIFGVVFSCMMSRGKSRIIMPLIAIVLESACMIVAYLFPNLVIPLADSKAVFFDMIQSFIIVCLMITASLIIYLTTYDKQRALLEYQSQELQRMMNVDAMTGVFNRRAYYEETNRISEHGREDDLVLVVMDVNGLKKINDTLGHSEGDAMIQTAADIISDAFQKYGNIFRTGGDEFTAILHCSDSVSYKLEDILNEAISRSNSKWASNMSIAIGVALWNQNKEMSFTSIEKLADEKMYQNKTNFYKKSGIDRRR